MTQFEGMDRTRFDQCIVEEGLNVDDFEITLKRDSPEVERTDSLGDAGTGTVTVTYKPTGIAGHYRYSVIPWPEVQFKSDLRMNQFKTR